MHTEWVCKPTVYYVGKGTRDFLMSNFVLLIFIALRVLVKIQIYLVIFEPFIHTKFILKYIHIYLNRYSSGENNDDEMIFVCVRGGEERRASRNTVKYE